MQRFWALLLWVFALGSSDQTEPGPAISSDIDGDQVSAALEGSLDHPLSDIQTALADPRHWCAVLVIHVNNKGCTVISEGFAATERHPRQLREVDLETYLSLKRQLRDVGIPPSDRVRS